jgi:hypothetical protein
VENSDLFRRSAAKNSERLVCAMVINRLLVLVSGFGLVSVSFIQREW